MPNGSSRRINSWTECLLKLDGVLAEPLNSAATSYVVRKAIDVALPTRTTVSAAASTLQLARLAEDVVPSDGCSCLCLAARWGRLLWVPLAAHHPYE